MAAPSSSDTGSGAAGWTPSRGLVFRSLLAARLVSVFFMHISDCDETYNYWEPLHYILYGSGFQTWEYSPTYALRSYGYVLLHSIPTHFTAKVHKGNKLVIFFLTRVMLAAICTLAEFYFYRAVRDKFGPRVAKWLLAFLVCGCGMFVASSAFLPSSFSMYLTMVALGAWFQHSYGLAVFAIAVSAIVGWPFSAALGIPIAVDLIFYRKQPLYFVLWSLLSLLLVAVPLVAVDSYYYGRLVCTPLNIILYNVFGKGGPNLYGVEPWTFYFVNGFLNFNVVFVLALLAVLLVELQVLSEAIVWSTTGKPSSWVQRSLTVLSLLYGRGRSLTSRANRAAAQSMCVWILIIFTRPHKEERFIFPIYPLFCLNAAIAVCLLPDVAQMVLGLLRAPRVLKAAVRSLLKWVPTLTCAVYVLLSCSRVIALYKGYHTPIDVYTQLGSDKLLTMVQPIYSDLNVCVGKEWYRFPSSFFLPSPKWHLRFVRSQFKGQLPKPYAKWPNGTWMVPEAMNDMNREEPTRYFDLADCHFMVDLVTSGSSKLEPCYACDHKNWLMVAKYPFLDASRSHQLFRAFYVPHLSELNTVYVDYTLLLHKPKFKEIVNKLTPEYDSSFI